MRTSGRERFAVIDTHAHFWRHPSGVQPPGTERPISVEGLLAAMDTAEVDKVLQVTRTVMAYDNSYSLEGAARYPDRIRVLGTLDPLRPGAIEELRTWLDRPYLTGVRLRWASIDISDPALRPFWAEAERTDAPLSIYAPHQAKTLGEVGRRYPGLRLIADHLMVRVYRVHDQPSPFEGWSDLLQLVSVPNIFLKVSGLPEATHEQYPFPMAQRYLRQIYEDFGADRLMWGSNYPPTLSVCSYREAVDFIRVASDFITPEDRRKILGGTATRVLRLSWQFRSVTNCC